MATDPLILPSRPKSQGHVEYVDHMGTDLSIVNAARVSFANVSDFEYSDVEPEEDSPISPWIEGHYDGGIRDGEWFWYRLAERDAKLISYLARNKHSSPFNHTFLSFRVKAPVFVARQLVKHKFMLWNEVSRRYVTFSPDFPELNWRMKAENVKQGSAGIFGPEAQAEISEHYWRVIDVALQEYDWMLAHGVCPEQARAVIPVAANTEWIWSGTLGAFADMLNLRDDSHVQPETRAVALQIDELIAPLFPRAWAALRGKLK